ncbi:hypothetical protein C8R47DRAFT_1148215 [Mycena vitilis]|nr:hypothetical protein C8R47DRAFT_1148215 [Mycena vitilis]
MDHDSFYDDLPNLQEVSCSEDDDDDDDEDSETESTAVNVANEEAIPAPTAPEPVETAEEKAVRLEKDGREYAAGSEQTRLREVDEKRKKQARARVDANERMQRHRERAREARIAEGHVSGKKRVGAPAACLQSSLTRALFCRSVWSSWTTIRRSHPMPVSQSYPGPTVNSRRMARRTTSHRAANSSPRTPSATPNTWQSPAICIRTPRLARRSTTISPPFAPPASRSPYSLSAGSWSATSKTTHRRSSSARWATEAAQHVPLLRVLRSALPSQHSRLERASCNEGCPEAPPESREGAGGCLLPRGLRRPGICRPRRATTDQTQLVYQQGAGSTWTQRGAKQVATVGQEEKRAFTLVPSISASGVLLPMQAVFQGKTAMSCPSPKASRYDEAIALGYVMLPSKTSTNWSNHDTMHWLVNDIIAPYFDAKKKELGLKPSQMSIWKIDCWSVHESKVFLGWMKEHHPTIIVLFVPGGCTGLWQPLDVGASSARLTVTSCMRR